MGNIDIWNRVLKRKKHVLNLHFPGHNCVLCMCIYIYICVWRSWKQVISCRQSLYGLARATMTLRSDWWTTMTSIVWSFPPALSWGWWTGHGYRQPKCLFQVSAEEILNHLRCALPCLREGGARNMWLMNKFSKWSKTTKPTQRGTHWAAEHSSPLNDPSKWSPICRFYFSPTTCSAPWMKEDHSPRR